MENNSLNFTDPILPQEKSKKILVNSCLYKNKNHIVNPSIFTNASILDKSDNKISHNVYLFEQTLALVVKSYYSSEYDIIKVINKIKAAIKEENSDISLNKRVKIKKKKNRNFSEINKKINNSKNNQNSKSSKNGNSIISSYNILDYIVSPLKNDYEFGKLKRALESKGYRSF
jgi:hypothetical protein